MSTERMACGCITSKSPLGVLAFQPCSLEHARYVMRRAVELGTPMETRVNPGCWSCGAANDDFTGIGETDPGVPDEDSISICAYCGALSIFTGQALLTRIPSADEFAELMSDETIRKPLLQFMTGTLRDE